MKVRPVEYLTEFCIPGCYSREVYVHRISNVLRTLRLLRRFPSVSPSTSIRPWTTDTPSSDVHMTESRRRGSGGSARKVSKVRATPVHLLDVFDLGWGFSRRPCNCLGFVVRPPEYLLNEGGSHPLPSFLRLT